MTSLNGISYAEMVSKLAKSGKDILVSMTENKLHVWHMASCIMGEVGELVEGYQQRDANNIKEELGDIEFYLQGLRNGLNITYDEIVTLDVSSHKATTYAVDGMVVWSANIFDACKKWIIYEKEIDYKKLIFALAVFEMYIRWARMRAGIIREDCLKSNMEKLARRYGPEYGYSNAAAQNRVDKIPQRKFLGQLDQ